MQELHERLSVDPPEYVNELQRQSNEVVVVVAEVCVHPPALNTARPTGQQNSAEFIICELFVRRICSTQQLQVCTRKACESSFIRKPSGWKFAALQLVADYLMVSMRVVNPTACTPQGLWLAVR